MTGGRRSALSLSLSHLHQGELLLRGVVVPGGPLVLLGVVWTLLVGVLVRGVDQFPGVLQETINLKHLNWNTSNGLEENHMTIWTTAVVMVTMVIN